MRYEKSKKIILVFSILTMLIIGAISVLGDAATTSKYLNGVEVRINTDKSVYKKGEQIILNVSANNNNSYELSNVEVEYTIPDEIIGNIKDASNFKTGFVDLSANTYKVLSSGLSITEPTTQTADVTTKPTVKETTTAKETTTVKEETTNAETTTVKEETTDSDTTKEESTDEKTSENEITSENSEDDSKEKESSKLWIIVIGALVVIILVIAGILIYKKKTTGKWWIVFILLSVGMSGAYLYNNLLTTEAAVSSGFTSVTHRISYDGKYHNISVKVSYQGIEKTAVSYGRVSVHDPSIIKHNDTYYIFGSHMAWAKSKDLTNWTTFRNNINNDYNTIFAKEFAWARMGDNNYQPAGNLWAPDVIYNKSMKKWCMYMSINGRSWNSSIVLLTADSLEGNWTYKGTVVQSGFTEKNYNHDFELTDYKKVTGDTTLPARYKRNVYITIDDIKNPSNNTEPTTWHDSYGAHAIDPGVFYGQDGKLYMTYGSWSGGIYILQLDKNSGLRDYNVKYSTVTNQSDAYMGKKIAGGYFASGEAPYIEYINGYYYLFTTYGGLTTTGGYNMRLFRSKNPDGPYVDAMGNSAIFTSWTDNIAGVRGVKVLSNYTWSFTPKAFMAGGHNSILVDDDGKIFNFYHTRFTNSGEGHEVRVHQMFVNKDGWLIQAPHEYSGEKEVKTGYSTDEIVGYYELLVHATSVSKANFVKPVTIKLKSDGTILQHVSYDEKGNETFVDAGSWKVTSNTNNIEITYNKKTYKGIVLKQAESSTSRRNVITITGLSTSNNTNLWASKK